MFSTLPKANFNFSVTYILSSANVLTLDYSKILSFGNELTLSLEYKSTDKSLQYKSFEYTAGKEEIACNEQFLLFPQCFLPNSTTVCHFHHKMSSADSFNYKESKICHLTLHQSA